MQRALGANSVPEFHGFEGPVHAAFPTNMFVGPANPYMVDTVRNVTGIKLIPDIHGGNANGVVFDPIVRTPTASVSSDEADTYVPLRA